jgi:type VI protein secretion system component Hcp
MILRSWLRTLFGRKTRPIVARPRARWRARPSLEVLEDRTLLSTTLGVTFDDGNGPLAELAVQSYSWGAARPSASGSPSVQNFTLALAPGNVESGLWGHLAAGSHLNSATIHVRQAQGGTATEYLTYTLKDVTISSFATNDSGGAPQDTIGLHFGSVSELYSPINPDGTLGTANVAEYDVAVARSGATGSLQGTPPASPPQLGLTFAGNKELTVQNYSWGAANPIALGSPGGGGGASGPSLQDFTLALAPGSVEPGLWGNLTAGTVLDTVTVHVRQAGGSTPTEYLTYTLKGVTISSFKTAADGSGAPQDTVTLRCNQVSESYSPINPDGSLGSANTAQYDLVAKTSGGAGSLQGPAPATAPQVGLTFVESGTTLPELSVARYSWGPDNPATIGATSLVSGSKPHVQDFTVVLAPGSVEPGLWGHLAAGMHLDSATLHVRTAAGGTEYLTYTLSNVFITSLTTSSDGSGAPQDTIGLRFESVSESYSPINPNGILGTPNTAQYNQVTNTSGSAGNVLIPHLTTPPQLGLVLLETGTPSPLSPELPIQSYSWGVTAPASLGSKPSVQEFTLTVAPGSVESALWGHLAAGSYFDSVAVYVRKAAGGTAYLAYTLSHVFITSFTTSEDGSGAPQDTIGLSFESVSEKYSPQNPDGTLGTPNTAQYDQVTNTTPFSGSLQSPGPSVPPDIGLTLADSAGTYHELGVQTYSWGATSPGGTSPSLRDVTLYLSPGSVEPGLWAHLAAGMHLNSVTIHVRKQHIPNSTEFATFTLSNVFISSFTTSSAGSSAPQDTITLRFGQVSESYSPINPDGSLGTANTAQYDQVKNTSGGAGSLQGAPPASPPQLGLTFAEGGVTLPELAVQSYSWGATKPIGSGPSLQDFTVSLAPGSVEPGLWGHLVAGMHLDSATLHVRTTAGGTEYLTYTLTDVTITAFDTGDESAVNPVPRGTIRLHFGQVSESYAPINPDGTLGAPNTAQYDQATNTNGGAGSLGPPDTTISAATLTSVTTSNGSTVYGDPVTFTATVAPASADGGTPRGTVDFFDGTTDVSGPIPLTTIGGQQVASFTTAALGAGTHTITASFADPTNTFSASSGTTSQVVAKATPTVTWASPADITYGTPLGAAQLDAAADVAESFTVQDNGFEQPDVSQGPGSFLYNPTGTPWTFTGTSGVVANGSAFGNVNAPEGTQAAFLQQQGSISQTVNLAAGTYFLSFWAAQRPGNSQTFQVHVDGVVVGTFTPAGTSYSLYATDSFTVTAGQHTIAFVGINPSGGDNTAFLDLVAVNGIVDGIFTYSPAAGTFLGAGSQTLAVTFTPTDTADYNQATASVTVNVLKATPTIIWPTPTAITYGTPLSSTQLDAVANSFTVQDPGFEQPDVSQGPGRFLYNPTGAPWTFTGSAGVVANGSAFGNANPPEGTQAAFLQQLGSISQMVDLAAGTYSLSFWAAQRPGNGQTFQVQVDGVVVGTFTPAGTSYSLYATDSFTVAAGQHTIAFVGTNPGGGDNTAFLDLVTVNVNGTFTYSPAAGTVLGAGSQTLAVTFTPNDTADYETVSASVPLTVTPATLTVTANNASRAYGVANPALSVSYTGFVNGETLATSGVTGRPTLSTPATARSVPGTYAIIPGAGSLAAANYAFTFVSGTLTVTPAPLAATGIHINAIAGAPFQGAVATFTNADPIGRVTSYTASIDWGDGSTSAGVITDLGGGKFQVSGSHTYAAPGSDTIRVTVRHNLGYTTTATPNSTATVTSLGSGVQRGLTASTGFWGTKGVALIKSFNGGGTATALSKWLATTFPNLYGAGAGNNNLTGMTNDQVAAFYTLRFPFAPTYFQVLAAALNVYATTASLGGTAAQAYGFTVSATGLGAHSFNVGADGAAMGVANQTTLDVYQLLQAVNKKAVNGVLYGGNATLQAQAADLFTSLNAAGGIV